MTSLKSSPAIDGQDFPLSVRNIAAQNSLLPPISIIELMNIQPEVPDETPNEAPNETPEGITRTILLKKHTPYQGHIPYVGQLSGQGILQSIQVPDSFTVSSIRFIKSGYGSEDCGNPEATVGVESGATIGTQKLLEIFESLQLPIYFLACVVGTSAPANVYISATFLAN
ncbi:hypothetical protein [Synechococcus sp. PCC 7335]|uniref:hypothetical protein n=1 Tax=Synechococcus sp. (strain ATCC 29403 / PCC 7335) TaxID=91464 RepID=UPI0002F21AC6|nr:hypothetical protein [Synechococcus sp. PCC 7335]